ncbi:helix-turn-helix domain-containing protein [Vibrio coralliilyticus]|uniref:helix-turn-helix domain-containing protein n=1 Tax=Vibrio TaxID=662 RepID=UPI000502EAA3|nr:MULTISPECIES: helix-turn-helix domain-containing protein [Vibrio]KFI11714.1 transcriptional regulator [Vibrio sp. B183]NOI18825.1 helix-turn-helix domain-containing protein [Vibrio coralliilyticus]
MIKVAILAHSHITLFEMSCAAELFALPRPEFDPWYYCEIINMENKDFESTGGVTLSTKFVESLKSYHTLIIPGWPTGDYEIPPLIQREIRQFVADGKRVLSLCSGSFLLGKLGLLRGRKATTHWMYENAFREHFPDVEYQKDVLYVLDGQIGCSAGSASALDLGLAIIRHDYGYQIANQVAKRLVISSHRTGGQAQFVETPMLKVPSTFSQAIAWASANLDKAITVEDWAQQASMSRRTFDRKFRTSFSLSPKEWLIQQRIERAKGLLETESLPIEQLANQAGFDNAVTMRHHFRRLVGVSPQKYRAQFGQN